MKIKLILAYCLLMFVTHDSIGMYWFRGDQARVMANTQQLKALQKYIHDCPDAKVVVVTDLHDVALKRSPGDFGRFWALPRWVKFRFMCAIIPFGLRYLSHKCCLPVEKPLIERAVLDNVSENEQQTLLPLLSPFVFDDRMYRWYKQSFFPVVGFSNIGPKSLVFLQRTYPEQMAIFKAVQCAGPAVGYRQKHLELRYRDLAPFIEQTVGYKPDAVFYIDDRSSCVRLCQRVLACENIAVFAYQFSTAHEFCNAIQRHAPGLLA